MDPVDLRRHCKQRLWAEATDLGQQIQSASSLAELAIVAIQVRETLTTARPTNAVIRVGFQEAIRDRYDQRTGTDAAD